MNVDSGQYALDVLKLEVPGMMGLLDAGITSDIKCSVPGLCTYLCEAQQWTCTWLHLHNLIAVDISNHFFKLPPLYSRSKHCKGTPPICVRRLGRAFRRQRMDGERRIVLPSLGLPRVRLTHPTLSGAYALLHRKL